jgi:Tol biopolymer transport system component
LFAGKAPGQKSFAFYVIRPNGGKPRRIPGFVFRGQGDTDGYDWHWSSDGRTIFALLDNTNDGFELLALECAGGRPRLLTPPKMNVGAFDLSPDRTQIVLDASTGSLPDTDIYVMRSDGTRLRRLTHGASDASPSWSPSGDQIAFVRSVAWGNEGGKIYVMNPDGSAQTQLTHATATQSSSDDAPSWVS